MTTTTTTPNPTSDQRIMSPTFVPRFDVWQNDEKVVLRGDLPGVSPEGLDIRYEDGRLVITGSVNPSREGNDRLLRQEYRVGNFERTFNIGNHIDIDRISAKIEGGVLNVDLPLSERVRPRRIKVNAG